VNKGQVTSIRDGVVRGTGVCDLVGDREAPALTVR
jgi:hypothetical protein